MREETMADRPRTDGREEGKEKAKKRNGVRKRVQWRVTHFEERVKRKTAGGQREIHSSMR